MCLYACSSGLERETERADKGRVQLVGVGFNATPHFAHICALVHL